MCEKDFAEYAERIPSEELPEAFAKVEEMKKHPKDIRVTVVRRK